MYEIKMRNEVGEIITFYNVDENDALRAAHSVQSATNGQIRVLSIEKIASDR